MQLGTYNPDISVVVLTYNRRPELARSLSYLSALPERPAIIVVDNGSTDDTVAYVQARHPETKLISTGSNLGAAGRNLGVAQVQTPLVAFSDDDTWWASGALDFAIRTFARQPQLAVLNASIKVGPEERPDPACRPMQESPLDSIAGVGPLLTGFMAGANVMRTQAFLQAGGYWEPFFIGGEEALLAIDILDHGWQIAYAPAMCVHHWPSSARESDLRKCLIARNAVWTACLRLPWSVAVQRSRLALEGLPSSMRRTVIRETAQHCAQLYRARRVARPQTLAVLERVWAMESQQWNLVRGAPGPS